MTIESNVARLTGGRYPAGLLTVNRATNGRPAAGGPHHYPTGNFAPPPDPRRPASSRRRATMPARSSNRNAGVAAPAVRDTNNGSYERSVLDRELRRRHDVSRWCSQHRVRDCGRAWRSDHPKCVPSATKYRCSHLDGPARARGAIAALSRAGAGSVSCKADQPRSVDRPADAEDLRNEQPGFAGVPPAAARSLDGRRTEVIRNEADNGPLPRAFVGGTAELLYDCHGCKGDHRPSDELPQAVHPGIVPRPTNIRRAARPGICIPRRNHVAGSVRFLADTLIPAVICSCMRLQKERTHQRSRRLRWFPWRRSKPA